jgi:hypothetical protein
MKKKCIKPFARRWGILVIATWTYRKSMGYPLNYYDTKGYVENFMKLMFEIPTGPYKGESSCY